MRWGGQRIGQVTTHPDWPGLVWMYLVALMSMSS